MSAEPLCGNQGTPPVGDMSGYRAETCPPDCKLQDICKDVEREKGITAAQVQTRLQSGNAADRLRGRLDFARFRLRVGEKVSAQSVPFPGAQKIIDMSCAHTRRTP